MREYGFCAVSTGMIDIFKRKFLVRKSVYCCDCRLCILEAGADGKMDEK